MLRKSYNLQLFSTDSIGWGKAGMSPRKFCGSWLRCGSALRSLALFTLTVWASGIASFTAVASGQTISLSDPPLEIAAGQPVRVSVAYDSPVDGIVQAQLFSADWKKVTEKWQEVKSGAATVELQLDVPADVDTAKKYLWQAVLYDADWKKQKDASRENIVCSKAATAEPGADSSDSTKEMKEDPKVGTAVKPDPSGKLVGEQNDVQEAWLPAGNWTIDWQDEFEGAGEPKKWFPMLGYDPDAFAANQMKGLRWTDATEDSAWMYSTKTENHWLDGKGNLVLRIVSDKTDKNLLGPKTKAAYLISGYPDKWDNTEPQNVKWAGKSVSPVEGPVYICVSVKTAQLKGWSTWFAFWLFSQTRSYNDNPADGTEVDVVEIVKGKPEYMSSIFTVANHWKDLGDGKPGSESKMFNPVSKPKAADLVDVNDDEFHTYGILWSKTEMKCFVDGKNYYTFTEHIPTDPVDMFMMLTLEFKENAWDPNQGDGRVEGPSVWEDEKRREMSRVLVDYVRVYRQASDK